MATRSLGTLTLDLIARIGGFEQGMDKAGRVSQKRLGEIQKSAEEVGKKVGTALAAVTTATLGVGTASLLMLKNTAENTAETEKWAKSLNIGVGVLQQWQYAAERAGLSGDNMADIFKDIGDKIGDALVTGGGEAIDALKKLGLEAEKLADLSPDKQLLAIADGLKKVGSQSEKINILESLGNDLSRMLPLLDNGAAGLNKFIKQASDFGIAMDPVQIANLVKANELIKDLEAQARGLRNEFVSGLANVNLSPLQDSLDGLRDIITDPTFQQNMSDLASWVVKLTGAAALGLAKLPDDLKNLANQYQILKAQITGTDKDRHLAGVAREQQLNDNLASYQSTNGGLNKLVTNPTLAVGDLFGQDLAAAKQASDQRLASYKAYTDQMGWSEKKTKDLAVATTVLNEQEKKVTESRKGASGITLKLLDSYDKLDKLQGDRAALVAAMSKDPENLERYKRALSDIDKQIASLDGTTKSATEAQQKFKQIQSEVEALQMQAKLLGLSSKEAALLQLSLKGATQAQLAAADAALAAVSAYEDQTKALENYKSLVADLMTPAEKANTQLRDRIKILKEAKVTGDEYAKSLERISSATVSKAPEFGGLDASVNGPAGELVKVVAAQGELEKWREDELQRQRDYLDEKLLNEQQYADNVYDIMRQSNDRQQTLQASWRAATIGTFATVTGDAADMLKELGGESSAVYKVMFLASKAASIAQAVINTELAAVRALAELGPIAGPPMAATVRGLGYASVGIMSATAIAGMAHNGIDNIPKEGTWLLDGGERVLNPNQNRDLTKFLNDSQPSGSSTSGGASISISAPITVQAQKGMSDQEAQQQGESMGQAFTAEVIRIIQGETLQGGVLWRRV